MNKIRYLISFVILFITVGMISYTHDWDSYEYMFNNDIKFIEFTFYYASYLIKMYGGDFRVLHIIFTSITSILFINFISKFTNKTLTVILLFIPSIFVFYSTQIRFYLALSLFLNSIYFYKVKKNYLVVIVLYMLALLSHYSSLLFLPFYFLLNINIRYFTIKKIIYYAILLFIFFFIIINMELPRELNTDYFIGSFESSFIGSLYNFTPYIFSFFFFLHVYKNNQVINLFLQDSKLSFLYKMSLLPYIYLPIAFLFQIIGRRFIFIVLLYQILSIIYINKNIKSTVLIRLKNIFWFFILFHLIYIYFAPYLFMNISNRIDDLILLFSSNTLFQ